MWLIVFEDASDCRAIAVTRHCRQSATRAEASAIDIAENSGSLKNRSESAKIALRSSQDITVLDGFSRCLGSRENATGAAAGLWASPL
jgi:hypothetical protein